MRTIVELVPNKVETEDLTSKYEYDYLTSEKTNESV